MFSFLMISQVISFVSYDIKPLYPELFLKPLKDRFGGVADVSFSHQQVTKLGSLSAVSKYLNEKGIHYDFDVNDYKQDVYETKMLNLEIGLKKVIQILELVVASVDIDPNTYLLATAHFVSEQFQPTNDRIRNMREQILVAINNGNYEKARVLLGKALHTIQDFYTNSNWLEMGKSDINYGIGYDVKDYGVQIALPTDKTCISNCDKIEIFCTPDVKYLVERGKKSELEIFPSCNLTYLKCYTNVISDKLTTLYYLQAVDENGKTIAKPPGKCNDGGILSTDAFAKPDDGINKDSSFYFISPRAELHVQAAALAIKHTDYFITWIRQQIGDEYFNELFDLNLKMKKSFDCMKCILNNY